MRYVESIGSNLQFVSPVATEPSLPVVTILGVFLIAVLMAVSGFFSSSEIAMFALPKHRLDALASDGVANATVAQRLREDPHRLLVTILVGNNVANIAMSSLATALLGFYVTEGQAVLLATFGVTSLVLLFSETVPKSYAVEHTDSWALRVARPLKISGYVLAPLVIVFDALTRVLNKLIGTETPIESAYVTRAELQELIEVSRQAGVIEADERDLLQRIFRFADTRASEIMVPRPDVVAVSSTASLEEAIQTAVYNRHTRLPVYESSLDTVIGIVHICDLVRERDYGERDPEKVELRDVLNPTLHVPESVPADEVLSKIQRAHIHMATIIDEFGTTEGIVTTEDPVEVIVGQILEPREPVPIDRLDEHTALIQGDVSVTEVNEALKVSLPEEPGYETIAGFLLSRTGRMVEEGERIVHDEVTIVVEDVTDNRIVTVRLVCTDPQNVQ
ncbi:hemolysin family protein [Natrialbaceae archaeon A-CW3]